MSKIAISGASTGSATFTIESPATSTNRTITIPDATTTLVGTDATQTLTNKTLTSPTITGANMSSMASSVITSATAQASTSGTSIDFTGIPSWVKRVTVLFNAVSTNGTSNYQVQLGDSGGIENTGYSSTASGTSNNGNVITVVNFTTGFGLTSVISAASTNVSGIMTICLLNPVNNLYAANGSLGAPPATFTGGYYFGGSKALSATLDRIRVTTVNGTDVFNSGTINILFE